MKRQCGQNAEFFCCFFLHENIWQTNCQRPFNLKQKKSLGLVSCSQVQWSTPGIPLPGKLKAEGHKSLFSLGYTARLFQKSFLRKQYIIIVCTVNCWISLKSKLLPIRTKSEATGKRTKGQFDLLRDSYLRVNK